ncbi:type 1 glutamine amidotransferase [Uliginosibacterium gangwonense]|uniref:type 1 glutamine amidotransferase n=1 Tax=Uliginosibacterium gangwonense TaxID=392736 RepID=UPI0003619936|nr:type 1 glutamine amidotransferase [Uliginosibacterium gangwonense]
MKVQVLQHVPFEDLGCIATWLAGRHAQIDYVRFHQGQIPPAGDFPDLVIALGGPMSVNDEAQFPWLKGEKHHVRALLSAQVPMLGICLGAQLIASAMGKKVYPAPEREIGWFPIQGCGNSDAALKFSFPATLNVFHWHGETFDLPAGAQRIARSAVCENQAFQLGRRCIGVQFHLETTRQSMLSMLENCAEDLHPTGKHVQTREVIETADDACYAKVNRVMGSLLDYLVEPSI